MNSKNIMTVMAVVTGLVGLASIILSTQITTTIFPTVGEEAIIVGVWHRQVLGAAILVLSIYFWFMRDAEEVVAKRFLFASGLCFSVNALVLIKASVIDGVTALPIPSFSILVIFGIASFYVSTKKTAKDELIAEIKEQISDK